METRLAKRPCQDSRVDLISKLPEHILHHILSLTPYQDAARTMILSTAWNRTWLSFPIIKFHEGQFLKEYVQRFYRCKEKNRNFITYVEKSLKPRLLNNQSLDKFTLCVSLNDKKDKHFIDRWVNFAIERQVKELDIQIEFHRDYRVPRTILNARGLTMLRLAAIKLVVRDDEIIKLTNLQSLCLFDLDADDLTIQKFIRSCPSIEVLDIRLCNGLENLHISTLSKLKKLRVRRCTYFESIHSDSASTLRELNLTALTITEDFINDQISKLSCLEVLHLEDCGPFRNLTISNKKLQGLSLVYCKTLVMAKIDTPNLQWLLLSRCSNLAVAKIDTPNLLFVEYDHNAWPFYSINTTYLSKPRLHFFIRHCVKDVWIDRLEEFFKKYKGYNNLKLQILNNKGLTIHEDFREIEASSLHCLEGSITISSECIAEMGFCDHFISSLTSVTSSCSLLLELISEKILNKEKYVGCCECEAAYNRCCKCGTAYKQCRQSRPRLKSLSVENFEGPSWNRKDCLRSYLGGLNRKLVSLRLHWEDARVQR